MQVVNLIGNTFMDAGCKKLHSLLNLRSLFLFYRNGNIDMISSIAEEKESTQKW